jgi:CMP-N,N'-diacetyllegionaminic acid synthase
MKILGIILARAGSEGLRNKHLLPLLGRPVISYTFEHARRARRLSRIVLTSDSAQIRQLAQHSMLETIARPAELATAEASVPATLLHALHTVEARSSFRADGVVVLYGNVPIRGEGDIDRAIELLERTGCDSVRSFCPVGKWHPAWMARLDDENRVRLLQPNNIHRRQDLEPVFLHDGGVIAVSRASLLRGEKHPDDPHAFFGDDRRAIRTEIGQVVEIDHLRDLYWAEAVLREREHERGESWRAAS